VDNDVSKVQMAFLVDANVSANVAMANYAVLMDDPRPVNVSSASLLILMDAIQGAAPAPESGALLQIQIL